MKTKHISSTSDSKKIENFNQFTTNENTFPYSCISETLFSVDFFVIKYIVKNFTDFDVCGLMCS